MSLIGGPFGTSGWFYAYFITSNVVLNISVTEGTGNPFSPVTHPKGGGFVCLERFKNS